MNRMMKIKMGMHAVCEYHKLGVDISNDKKNETLVLIREEISDIQKDHDNHRLGKFPTKEELAKRFALGVFLFDLLCPSWYNGIDIEKLDMGSAHHDVLGQLYGSYMEGCRKLGITGQTFYCGHNAIREKDRDYLRDLWIKEATNRKIEDSQPIVKDRRESILKKHLRTD